MPSTNSQIAKLLEPAPPIETLIADGFNEDLGKSHNTTLLPLDLNSLEVLCRLYLPGVVLERLAVSESFIDEPLGFKQIIGFSCGVDIRPFQVTIIQCTSHVDAIKLMKQALCGVTYIRDTRDLEAVKNKKIGNYTVKSKDDSLIIYTRWTTVIQLFSPNAPDDGRPSVDLQALASRLDRALKAHKGTISKVPKACLGEMLEKPIFEDMTETLNVEFEGEIHDVREYRIIQDEKECVVKNDATSMFGSYGYAGGRFFFDLEITRCKWPFQINVAILMAHKSSLWPAMEQIFMDGS